LKIIQQYFDPKGAMDAPKVFVAPFIKGETEGVTRIDSDVRDLAVR